MSKQILLEMAILDSIVIEEDEVNQSLDQQVESLILQAGGKEGAERALGQSIKDFRREFWYEMQDRLITERYQQSLLSNIKVTREDIRSFLLVYKDSLPIEPTKYQIRHLLRKVKPESARNICSGPARTARLLSKNLCVIVPAVSSTKVPG